jgi:hypothetical protein
MLSLFRVLAVLAFGLIATLPATAGQPSGTAAWTTDGKVPFTGQLFAGPGPHYRAAGTVAANIRVRVERCTERWCLIRAGKARGWIGIDVLSFGQRPASVFGGPRFDFGSGGEVCFYDGADFTGRAFCAGPGRVWDDLVLIGRDNAISSIRVGSGSALVCRDRNFRSHCVRMNADAPRLDGLVNNAISSIRVY